MLKIKLKQNGSKKKPFYKILVMLNLSKLTGKAIDILGYYDPLKKKINLNKIKLFKYINLGVKPTNTVRHLIYQLISHS